MKKNKVTKPMPLQSLVYFISANKILLNPEYQREAVWTLSQKQLLIDSLLLDIDIPKLYFREISKGDYQYEVVDGQQRLRSVDEYFRNQFAMPDFADPIEGHDVKNKSFSQLDMELQMKLQNTALDVVIMNSAYLDDDIEEIFLRLQNGTPLNAAEKRRAIPGNMKAVVQDLASSDVFKLCAFKDKRFAYEDVAAKLLHIMLAGSITDIKPASIRRTYESNKTISRENATVAKMEKALRFVVKAFKDTPSPQLKKFSVITLGYLVNEMLDKYNISKFPIEFANSYIQFELTRRQNEELPEEKQDPRYSAYTNAARSDSLQDMRYRHEFLMEVIVRDIPALVLKDPTRGFSDEQRAAIYWRDKGICQECGKECAENEFHADHINSHANGGETTIANGQVLCPECNLKKSG